MNIDLEKAEKEVTDSDKIKYKIKYIINFCRKG